MHITAEEGAVVVLGETLDAIKAELKKTVSQGLVAQSALHLDRLETKAAATESEADTLASMILSAAACRIAIDRVVTASQAGEPDGGEAGEISHGETAHTLVRYADHFAEQLQGWIDQAVLRGDYTDAKEVARCLNRLVLTRKKLAQPAPVCVNEQESRDIPGDARSYEEEDLQQKLQSASLMRDALEEGRQGSATAGRVSTKLSPSTRRTLNRKKRRSNSKWKRVALVAGLIAAGVLAVALRPAPLAEPPAPPDVGELSSDLALTDISVVGRVVFARAGNWKDLDDEQRASAANRACESAKALGFKGLVLSDETDEIVQSCTAQKE